MILPCLLAFLAPDRSPETCGPAAFDHGAHVFHDSEEDGRLWARGARWKMGFGAEGAVFYPLFGPGQERHHPLFLSPAAVHLGGEALPVERAAAPARAGDRVTFDRGSFIEAYDLAPGSVQQSFLFPEVPRGADLWLELATGVDLPGLERPGALEFRHALGRLDYTQAVALDGAGRMLPLETRLDGAGIRIGVPAWFLDLAVAPLVVDPVLGVFPIETSDAYEDRAADVSYDASSQRWLVVWTREVTATDNDLPYVLLSDAGAPLSGGYVNLGVQSWDAPSVANLNAFNTFYIAATAPASGDGFVIRGRALSATAPPGSSGGPVYQLSDAAATKLDPPIQSFDPAVGGDTSANVAHTRFCIAWKRRVGLSGALMACYRFVDFQGAPFPGFQILSGGDALAAGPAVSPSNGGSEWALAYATTDDRLMQARLSWSGALALAPQVLAGDTPATLLRVSSPVNGRHAFALGEHHGTEVRLLLAQGGVVQDEASVIPMEAELLQLDLATDGARFVLAHQSATFEQLGSVSELAAFVANPLTGQLSAVEQVTVPGSVPRFFDGHLAARSESAGPAGKALFAWSQLDLLVESDVHAAFYKAP